jgi:hypothetical protein
MADSKMSAAKGVACFGTAGLHSKVCIVLCMMEFEGNFEENTVDTSYSLCIKKYECGIAAFVFFEIVRVPHVGVEVSLAACCWTNCVHVCVVPVCVVICVRRHILRHIAASSLARYVGTVTRQ